MSSVGVIQSLNFKSARSGEAGLSFLNDGTFGNTLNLGQILKAKVLRHYEGSSYLVDFGGNEKIVDSAVPLRSDEVIYGRVVGLDEKVHLRRIPAALSVSELSTAALETQARLSARGSLDDLLQQLHLKFNISFAETEAKILQTLLRSAPSPSIAILSGVILKKLGISLHPEALAALNKTLKNDIKVLDQASRIEAPTRGEKSVSQDEIVRLVKDVSRVVHNHVQRESSAEVVSADALGKKDADLIDPGMEQDSGFARQEEGRQNQWLLGKYLLNSQQDCSVAHKYTTIPLWIGDKYVELDLALLSQRDASRKAGGLRHQHLAFSLDFEHLGKVEMSAIVSDRHVSLNVATDSEEKAELLAENLGALRESLAQHEWILESMRYQAASTGQMGMAIKTIVEHHVSQDSVNQLY